MDFTEYIAKVTGVIWAGCKAHTSYTFYKLPTREEVMERSGDFQRVVSIKIIKRTTRTETVALA